MQKPIFSQETPVESHSKIAQLQAAAAASAILQELTTDEAWRSVAVAMKDCRNPILDRWGEVTWAGYDRINDCGMSF